jgi:hypothetical protein
MLLVFGRVELVVEVVLLQELVVLTKGQAVDAVPDCAGGCNCDGDLVSLNEALETVGLDLNNGGFHYCSISV